MAAFGDKHPAARQGKAGVWTAAAAMLLACGHRDASGPGAPTSAVDVAAEVFDTAGGQAADTGASCPAGSDRCQGACLPACATATVRQTTTCLCRDPTPPPTAKHAAVDGRFCLSVNPMWGSDAASKARRQFVYAAAKQLGISTLRFHFLWAELEPKQGQFLWDAVDTVRAECQAAGLDLLLVLAYGAPWASKLAQKNGNDDHYPPDDPATFANYAAQLAAHVSSTVRDFEVWNEQNAGYRFWKGEPDGLNGNPAAYAKLLSATAKAVHGVDPKMRVSFGGLFYVPQLIVGAEDFFDQSLAALPQLAGEFDAVAYHPYGAYPPLKPPEFANRASPVPVFPIDECAQRMTAVLQKHGAPPKPQWVTELGWPDIAGGDPAQVARWLARGYTLLLSQDVAHICWYTMDDSDVAKADAPWEAGFGLYTYNPDFLDGTLPQPKPVALAHAQMAKQLQGLGWAADETRGTVRAHAFTSPDGARAVHVVWDDTLPVATTVPSDAAITVPWPARVGRQYQFTPALGAAMALQPDSSGLLAVPVRASAGYLQETAAGGN